MSQYHYVDAEGKAEGPLSLEDMRALFIDGLLHRKSIVSKNGSSWAEARKFPELSGKARTSELHQVFVSSKREEPKAPEGFAMAALLTFLFPLLGLLGAMYYAVKGHSAAALGLLLLSIATSVLFYVVWFRLLHPS